VSSDFDDLAETMAIVAPPNVRVAATDEGLRITVLDPRRMAAELVVFAVTPKSDEWRSRKGDIVASFDRFNVTATEISQHANGADSGLALAQDIYNAGVVLNPHGWSDVLRFDYADVATDIDVWMGR